MVRYFEYLAEGLIYLAVLFWIITLFGLYKPWIALWWSDYCPRKKVLKVYGGIALALSIVYISIRLVLIDYYQ